MQKTVGCCTPHKNRPSENTGYQHDCNSFIKMQNISPTAAITLSILSSVVSYDNVLDVQNFMETLKELTLFFKYLATRKHILSEHLKYPQEDFLVECVDSDHVSMRRYHGLPVLSDTC